jgi:hypothetical protein
MAAIDVYAGDGEQADDGDVQAPARAPHGQGNRSNARLVRCSTQDQALAAQLRASGGAEPYPPQGSQRAAREQAFGKHRVSCRILASRSGGMADAADSKSVGRKAVKVRLLSPAPIFR